MKQYHLVKYIFDGVCHGTVPWQAQGGTSGNAINGVSSHNPKKEQYEQARRKEFGE